VRIAEELPQWRPPSFSKCDECMDFRIKSLFFPWRCAHFSSEKMGGANAAETFLPVDNWFSLPGQLY
jgi:hypothetical protein